MIIRHCTTGKPGSIVLSDSAHKKLDEEIRNQIHFEEAKMEMKGKGIVNTYIIDLFGSERNLKKHNLGKLALDKSDSNLTIAV